MMSDWGVLFRKLTLDGFFNWRKILAYTFPNKNDDGPKITDNFPLKICGFLAPIFSLAIFYKIYFQPPEVLSYFRMAGRAIYVITIGYAVFFFLLLLLCSLILKLRHRNPSLLLSMTILPPLKAFLAFSALNFLFSFAELDERQARISALDEHFAKKKEAMRQEKAELHEQLTKGIEKFEVAFEENRRNTHRHLDQHFEDVKTQGNAVKDYVNQRFADYEKWCKEASSPEARAKLAKEASERFQATSKKMWDDFEARRLEVRAKQQIKEQEIKDRTKLKNSRSNL